MLQTPAHGDAAPNCPRHATALRLVQDARRGTRWRCYACRREADARYDARHPGRRKTRTDRLRAAGLCIACGQDVAVTETRCFDCANQLCEEAIRYRL